MKTTKTHITSVEEHKAKLRLLADRKRLFKEVLTNAIKNKRKKEGK